ncbi:MAG: hypothetical protein JSV16_01060 [Candidatus Hydrogenedentota bacterium]|nr:MAG: hypothetical protein JSV16_01060 [Candidatus Hydrogenedentota bacterium]
MDIEAISKLILAVSIGLYGLHLFLIFRRIIRRNSGLNIDLPRPEKLRFSGIRKRMYKIVHFAFEFGGELPDERAEEER